MSLDKNAQKETLIWQALKRGSPLFSSTIMQDLNMKLVFLTGPGQVGKTWLDENSGYRKCKA
jgi:predicted AAA+ superfamily ATPase